LTYNIAYKKSASRDLAKLPKDEARRILRRIERDLAKKAESFPVLKGRFAGLRKCRVGDYRVVYAVIGQDVLVLRIGHRRNVYR